MRRRPPQRSRRGPVLAGAVVAALAVIVVVRGGGDARVELAGASVALPAEGRRAVEVVRVGERDASRVVAVRGARERSVTAVPGDHGSGVDLLVTLFGADAVLTERPFDVDGARVLAGTVTRAAWRGRFRAYLTPAGAWVLVAGAADDGAFAESAEVGAFLASFRAPGR